MPGSAGGASAGPAGGAASAGAGGEAGEGSGVTVAAGGTLGGVVAGAGASFCGAGAGFPGPGIATGGGGAAGARGCMTSMSVLVSRAGTPAAVLLLFGLIFNSVEFRSKRGQRCWNCLRGRASSAAALATS